MRARRRKGRTARGRAPASGGCALAPPDAMRPADWVFRTEEPERRAAMRRAADILRLITSTVLLAVIIILILLAPGFLSDQCSTVPISAATGANP
jgi:hypothetical protein